MSALIIALVVLVLIAIGIVVRLLIAELSKPAPGQAKTARKAAAPPAAPASPPTAVVGPESAVVGGPPPTRTQADDAALAASVGIGGTATALAERPVPAAPARRTRKARMRDVVEKGDGVRISAWRRIRSFVSLLVLVLVLGTGAAAVVGGFVLLIALALEQAIN